MLGSTVAGATIGAVDGALIGGDRGAGHGVCTAANAQRHDDIADEQGMRAKGNPVSGGGYRFNRPVPAPPPPR